ncbi:MAG TPA: NUDIX hydrolase [Acidimicrobiales bacterium]|nr:NUDIX hydrolase [Acidimicrobiales bacterium]
MLKWELLGKRPGSSGWVTVSTATYRMPDGSEAEWDVIEGSDIVELVALTTDDEVILVRQFRPGPGVVLNELPGGIVDPGESPAGAAARELLEETGYEGDLRVFGYCFRGSAEVRRQWLAVATGCRKVTEPAPGALEFLEVVLMGVAEFREHLRTGMLTDTGAAYRGLEELERL